MRMSRCVCLGASGAAFETSMCQRGRRVSSDVRQIPQTVGARVKTAVHVRCSRAGRHHTEMVVRSGGMYREAPRLRTMCVWWLGMSVSSSHPPLV
eukprot:39336-Pleurochrysis_carterae.AAC.1